jgi:hypothetical protein
MLLEQQELLAQACCGKSNDANEQQHRKKGIWRQRSQGIIQPTQHGILAQPKQHDWCLASRPPSRVGHKHTQLTDYHVYNKKSTHFVVTSYEETLTYPSMPLSSVVHPHVVFPISRAHIQRAALNQIYTLLILSSLLLSCFLKHRNQQLSLSI